MTDFDKIIWRDALTFIDFFATWCGPCQLMRPAVDKFQERMKGRVDVYAIDIDDPEMSEIVRRYNIMSVPTLVLRSGPASVVIYSLLCGHRHLRRHVPARRPVLRTGSRYAFHDYP